MKKIKIGVDLGGSHVSVGIVKDSTVIEQFEKDFTVEEKKDLINVAIDFIVATINDLKKIYSFENFGLGMAGVIKDGIILQSPNIGLKNFNMKEILESKTSKKVTISNDASCAALGEYKYGNLSNYNRILFLTLGTGIGGIFIQNGKILEGDDYTELGHTVIKPNGIQCGCGKKGCFERYGSILVFKNKIIERLNLSHDISGPDLRTEIKLNQEQVADIIEEYLNDLCIGLNILIAKLSPDAIVIGGGFARYDYLLLEPLKQKLFSNSNLNKNSILIKTATLGNDAGIIGASML